MITQKLTHLLTNLPKPSEYFTEGLWRELHPFDKGRADRLRQMLMNFGFYPCRKPGETLSPALERGDRQAEANSRAILHALADELDRDDAVALAQLAKLLLLEPCPPELKEKYYRQSWGIPESSPKKEVELTPEQWAGAIADVEAVIADIKAKHLANREN